MKKIFIFLLLSAGIFLFIAVEGSHRTLRSDIFSKDTLSNISPKDYFSTESQLVNTILTRYHYRKFKLNDSLSSVVFDRYIESLDYSRSYFLESDIKSLENYRYKIDDFIMEGDVVPAFDIFNVYRHRLIYIVKYADSLLNKEFDFTIDENFEIDRSKSPWPKSEGELLEIWRKRIKNDALNLKLTGKEWPAISETLRKRYNNLRKAVLQYNSDDVFQLYMNAYTSALDPHSNYLSPITFDNFNIDMSLSFEGIGATLQNDEDYTKIVEIIPGGPASRSGILKVNDRIVSVAQGEDGEFIDVIGWRINDVVKLIRGPKGTVVRLQILPEGAGADFIPIVVSLVRDKIILEEQAANKSVLELTRDDKSYRIGVIKIPKFYTSFNSKDQSETKSTTKDVKKLIKELQQENIDGIIIDLRNDGGGALSEAIELTGLFIKDGPVVQVRNSDGSIEIGDDPDPRLFYDGPLVVLVNRFSASASEIFSGAIQDYERGLIVGEKTFGKGTVQNLLDLNRMIPNSENKFGQIKLTVAKYYRINGGSTQNLGVIPDIQLPTAFNHDEFGESSEKNALPWDQINPTDYQKVGSLSSVIPELRERHSSRIEKNAEFDYIFEQIEEYNASRDRKCISLNEDIRKKEKEAEEEKSFQRENLRREKLGLKLLEKGEIPKESPDNDDILLKETGNILADFIELEIK